jgi:hypothetical protein
MVYANKPLINLYIHFISAFYEDTSQPWKGNMTEGKSCV